MAKEEFTKSTIKQENKAKVAFSFIQPGRSVYSALPPEVLVRGGEIISWGKRNAFPQYLVDRITESPTLNTIINGCTDYIMGEGVKYLNIHNFDAEALNQDGDDLQDVICKLASDLVSFGGCAFQIIYNSFGTPAEIYYIDISRCRLSKNYDKVYYTNKKWSTYTNEYEVYPAFGFADPGEKITEIYFYRGKNPRTNYPVPLYYSALTAIETEIEIQKFHFNSIINNFNVNSIINFNNGIPSDEEKRQIEKGIQDKFTGSENAAVPWIAWNDNKAHAVTVERLSEDNFDKKYAALYTTTRQNIYAAFRAIPVLFGIMTDTTGFNKQEFDEAFTLFNRTLIMPRQKEIERIFDDAFNAKGSIRFKPFKIDFNNSQEEQVQN